MSNTDESQITIVHNGNAYTATYWIRGGTVTVHSGIAPDETVDVSALDKQADEVAKFVLKKHIEQFA